MGADKQLQVKESVVARDSNENVRDQLPDREWRYRTSRWTTKELQKGMELHAELHAGVSRKLVLRMQS